MECRKFKDSIDSYLCSELLVETNLEMLRHAEHCPACRTELNGRRQLRLQMQRIGTQQNMSEAGHERLRMRLREEGALNSGKLDWLNWFRRPMTSRFLLTTTASLLCLVFMAWYFNRKTVPLVSAATLSPLVVKQAVEEHELCAHFYATSPEPAGMAPSAVEYDAAYAGLDRIAKMRAAGLQLHAAHKCSLVGRNFAHLLFSRDTDLISFLVTERDAEAMLAGKVPNDDGQGAGLEQIVQAGCAIHAYQSPRHIVLTVSKLSAAENKKLAEEVASPLSVHLRSVAKTK
jgi:hypothetical protein